MNQFIRALLIAAATLLVTACPTYEDDPKPDTPTAEYTLPGEWEAVSTA